ncbi:unnamed protein product [Paramecium pentaurelia]|uniref:Tetratricopeptide repeat protein n=1 Tax=Paramecium pentaurelia TaxID=43138 RepID=A0A8S1YDM1_9CILI|nr:unnamed protein product [Paramecium pentaurelia]
MKQQKLFTCQDIEHEGEDIQGFCLNLGCQDSRPQFCLQCGVDPMKHSNCKKDLKGFGFISSFITKFNQNILDLITQLDKSFSQVKQKYEEFQKQLEKMKLQLFKISQCLSQQDYNQMKENLQLIKEGYQYCNNQEEIRKQNQIGTQLLNIKKMIEAWNLDKAQQQTQGIDDQSILQQGLLLLNQQKWQQANELLIKNIKDLEKQLSFATLFQSISLIEINQPGKGMIMRDQAKKINSSLYKDLLEYSDQELKKNPQNPFILILKSYALNDDNKFHLAIEQCDKVLKGDPQNLHALYRKGLYLINQKEYEQAISCIEKALKSNPNYSICYFIKGVSLSNLNKYEDAISCYDKAIQIDPNYAQAYNNKGNSLRNLNKYEDAISCYDKAIQIDPNYAQAYINKGVSLRNLNKYEDAISCYDKAIQIDPNYAQAYNNKGYSLDDLKKYEDAISCYDKAIQIDPNYAKAYFNKGYSLTILKKNQLAIANYELAIKYCKTDEDEFKRRIQEIKNNK